MIANREVTHSMGPPNRSQCGETTVRKSKQTEEYAFALILSTGRTEFRNELGYTKSIATEGPDE